MRFMLKLMANLTDPRDGDVSDRIINALSKVAPTPDPHRTTHDAEQQDEGREG